VDALEGLDAMFLALETPTVHLQIGAVLVLDAPEGRRSLFSPTTRFDQIRRMVESRLHLAPPLRRRVVSAPLALHRPVWVDDPEFDVDAHVRRVRLPRPAGPAELCELVGDLMSRSLPPDRPLWEMVVVEGMPGERTALVFRVHHALLDGVSGAELLAAFLDLSPRARPIAPLPVASPTPPPLPGPVDLLRQALGGLVRQPATTLSAAHRMIEAGLGLAARNRRLGESGESPPPSPFAAPRLPFNGTVGALRRYATADLSLAEVKTVAEAFGTTVNDVVLACVAGGLRRYLLQHQEPVPDALVAMVPISVRARGGGAAAEGEAGSLGNRISAMFVGLPTGLFHPVDRLLAVSQAARGAKEQASLLGGEIVMQVAGAVPYALSTRVVRWLAAWRVYDRARPPANVTVSNVTGPSQTLWCAGSRVHALYPAGPVADGMGLNVTVPSYGGTVHLGLLACRRLVPDLDEMATAMADEEKRLLMAASKATGVVEAG
jgi:diacylglycerol O-acyltransferase / wax synthase